MRSPIHLLTLVTHTALLILTASLLLSALAWPWNAAAAALACTPLVIAYPGLLALRRYTLQWLSIVLVLHISLTVMEVIVSAAGAVPVLTLLAGLSELSLLFVLIRLSGSAPARPDPQAANE
jgi:uncharacterized membrane protein